MTKTILTVFFLRHGVELASCCCCLPFVVVVVFVVCSFCNIFINLTLCNAYMLQKGHLACICLFTQF